MCFQSDKIDTGGNQSVVCHEPVYSTVVGTFLAGITVIVWLSLFYFLQSLFALVEVSPAVDGSLSFELKSDF